MKEFEAVVASEVEIADEFSTERVQRKNTETPVAENGRCGRAFFAIKKQAQKRGFEEERKDAFHGQGSGR